MTQAEIRILVCSVSANIGSPCTCCLKFYSSRSKNTLQGTIGSRLTGTRYVGSYYIPIGGLLLLVTGTDLRNIRVFQDLKPIVADNGYRLAPSLIYCFSNRLLYLLIWTYWKIKIGEGSVDRQSHIPIPYPKNNSLLYCKSCFPEHTDQRKRYRSLFL